MEGLDLSTKKIISILLLQQQILLLNLIKWRQYQIKKKRKKRYWMWKIFQEREEKSLFTTLVKHLQLFDREYFFKNFRMYTRTFEDLFSWMAPIIQKSSTATPAERLSVTLRYLATGDSQTTIGTSYRISPTTMGRIISETCQTLWRVLSEKGFITAPDSD